MNLFGHFQTLVRNELSAMMAAGELKPGGVLAAIEGPDGDALIAGRDQLLERLVAQRGDGGALPLVGGGQGEFIEEQGEVVSGCVVHTRQ